ncbi:MAG: HlyD family efflux transporter periplasmic adaptor subunit [Alphaproteobacteria bacterium]|nr:HlyD family efflux transporter periplasmic adaptor subunit [Alphaproteobacteria bacterium]MCB9792653.1 HlyD family efflux transporter periplasmic adaptor subunit [Alphaproteobacteria bacterium]
MLYARQRPPATAGPHPGFTALRRVRSPARLRTVARGLIAALALLCVALVVLPWQQTALGQGRVVAYAPVDRQQTLDASISGRAVRWFVNEGDPVTAGDPIVELADNDPRMMERLRQERETLEQQEIAQQGRVNSYTARIRALEESRELTQRVADAEVSMAERKLTAAEETLRADEAANRTSQLNLERTQALRAEGLASTRELELAELGMQQASSSLARSKANLQVAEADLAAAKLDRDVALREANAKINSVEADLQSAIASEAAVRQKLLNLDVRMARQQTALVTAPRDGTILKVLAGQGGEQVKAGEPLVMMIPDTTSRAVELWVDGNDVPLLHAADQVRLQFEGWPAIQFSGWPSVAVGTFGGQIAFIDAADDGYGRFRVLVTPDPSEPAWPAASYLRQGAKAKGWVLLAEVPLGYELWRQLNDFPPAVKLDMLEDPSKADMKSSGPAGGGK